MSHDLARSTYCITAVVWPGNFVEITLCHAALLDSDYFFEPHTNTPRVRSLATSDIWPPPGIVSSVTGKICIPNLSNEPYSLTHNEHFYQYLNVLPQQWPPWLQLPQPPPMCLLILTFSVLQILNPSSLPRLKSTTLPLNQIFQATIVLEVPSLLKWIWDLLSPHNVKGVSLSILATNCLSFS